MELTVVHRDRPRATCLKCGTRSGVAPHDHVLYTTAKSIDEAAKLAGRVAALLGGGVTAAQVGPWGCHDFVVLGGVHPAAALEGGAAERLGP